MRNSQQEIATPQIAKSTITKKNKYFTTKRVVYCATLIAASLIFKMLGNVLNFGSFKISFVYTAWILSAMIMGPIGGAIVGLTTDILGTFIVPTGGTPIPLIILGNTLFPFILGIVYKFFPKDYKTFGLYTGAVLSILICTLGFNTFALSRLYEINYFAYIVVRLPQIPVIIFNVILANVIFNVLAKTNSLLV